MWTHVVLADSMTHSQLVEQGWEWIAQKEEHAIQEQSHGYFLQRPERPIWIPVVQLALVLLYFSMSRFQARLAGHFPRYTLHRENQRLR